MSMENPLESPSTSTDFHMYRTSSTPLPANRQAISTRNSSALSRSFMLTTVLYSLANRFGLHVQNTAILKDGKLYFRRKLKKIRRIRKSPRSYSWRKATTGFSLEALLAGQIPKDKPTATIRQGQRQQPKLVLRAL